MLSESRQSAEQTHTLSVSPQERLWQPISLKTDAINPAKAVSGDNYETSRSVWPVATHKTWRMQRDAPVDSHSSSVSPNYCVSSACWVMQNRDLPCRWSGPLLWICLSFLCPPRFPPLRFCRVSPGRFHTPHCQTQTHKNCFNQKIQTLRFYQHSWHAFEDIYCITKFISKKITFYKLKLHLPIWF